MRTIFNILIYLALSFLIGATTFFGIAVAGAVFNGLIPSKAISGAINSAILFKLAFIHVVASIVLFAVFLFKSITFKKKSFWLGSLISIVLINISIYNYTTFLPNIDKLRVEIGNFDNVAENKLELKKEFDELHKKYSNLVKLILFLSVSILVLNNLAKEEKAIKVEKAQDKKNGKLPSEKNITENTDVANVQNEKVEDLNGTSLATTDLETNLGTNNVLAKAVAEISKNNPLE